MLAQYGDGSDFMMLALFGLSLYFGGITLGLLGVLTLSLKDKRFSFVVWLMDRKAVYEHMIKSTSFFH
jgi:hypothetical protein